MSKPRPIHSAPRLLRETPDEAEPSYSYEAETFLGREEDDVEDEFHRRLASNRLAREGNGTTGGASGSFWRTDMDQQQMEQSQGYRRSGSSMSQNSASSAKKQIQDNKRDLQKQRNEARRLWMKKGESCYGVK